jgi:ankyrin repeat protein
MTINSLVNYIRDSQEGMSPSKAAQIFSRALEKYLNMPGHRVDDETPYGGTLLMQAAQASNIEIIRVLLDRGAQLDTKIFLFAMNRLSVLEYLLEALAPSADQRQMFLDTLLLELLSLYPSNENKPTVEWLLNKGANPNCKNQMGESPLLLAVKAGAFKLVELLLARKVNVNQADNNRTTPLMCAVADKHRSIDTVQLLLQAKASVDVENSYGQTPLTLSAAAGLNQITKLLLERTKYEPHTLQGSLPLAAAFSTRKIDVMNTLIQYGMSLTVVPKRLMYNKDLQSRLLNFSHEASRLVPANSPIIPNWMDFHNCLMKDFARKAGEQVARKTCFPADVAQIVNSYLFRDLSLLTLYNKAFISNSKIANAQKNKTHLQISPEKLNPKKAKLRESVFTKTPKPKSAAKRNCRR